MDNLIYILFISVFVPILLMACLIEKKARLPIIFVLIGIFVSVFAAEVNGLLCVLLPMSTYEITIIVTPIRRRQGDGLEPGRGDAVLGRRREGD